MEDGKVTIEREQKRKEEKFKYKDGLRYPGMQSNSFLGHPTRVTICLDQVVETSVCHSLYDHTSTQLRREEYNSNFSHYLALGFNIQVLL
jgi:hypothetical protein